MPEFHHLVLPNGLEIVAEHLPDAHSVAAGFFVRAGARDENDEINGVSHFLEHMVFKGTSRYSAEDVNRIFDELGAQYNAATGEEQTMFYAAVLPEYLKDVLELQADVLFPSLRQSDFETEKQVILEEIGMYDDQPSWVAYDHAMQEFFRGHPLGRPILGSPESVRGLTAEQMNQYHVDRYRAGNIVLAVAGRFDWDEVQRLAHEQCGQWPAGGSIRTRSPWAGMSGTRHIERSAIQLSQVMQVASAPDAQHRLRFAADLLTTVVGDDDNSRLFWLLVDSGDAEMAEVSYNEYDDAGTYLTYLSCAPEDVDVNLAVIGEEFARINREGITAEELELARNKLGTRVVLRGERPLGRLSALGNNWLTRHEYRTVAEDVAAIQAVTLDDIHELLAGWPLQQQATVIVGPHPE